MLCAREQPFWVVIVCESGFGIAKRRLLAAREVIEVADHERLKAEPGAGELAAPHEMKKMARRMAVARRCLCDALPAELVQDPVLDMLLAIYQADDPIAVGNLSFYTTVSATVTGRWLKVIESRNLVSVSEGRVLLTDFGQAQVDRMLSAVIVGQLAL